MTPQELKNSILQLAIQGKLVEQRAEEGTAEELYKQIQAEKLKLIQEGKIKKEKPLPEITEVEKSFEIPVSWRWVRLDDVVIKNIKRGKSPTYINSSATLVFAQKCNVKTGGIDMSLAQFLDESTLVKYPEEEFMCNEDIVVNSTGNGTLGRIGIFNSTDNVSGKKIVPDSHVTVIRVSKDMKKKYIYHCLKSSQPYFERMGDGSTNQTELKPLVLRMQLIPLPPLAEQHRIVAKIEKLLPYIDRYEQAWSKLEAFNKRFPTDMQKSILQMAIQGKLIEQRPEEGTAEELFAQIQAEKQKLIQEGKIKKQKPLPEILENEIPFEIPHGWKMVKFGDVVTLLSGTDFKPEEYNDSNIGIPYITGASSLSDCGVLVNRWTNNPRLIASLGDILLVCKGSGYGKTVICDIQQAHIARQIMAVKKANSLYMNYIKIYLDASFGLLKSYGQGVIPGIDRGSVLNMVFPLPPLAEQKRIVAKLEELLPLCERLK